MISGVSSTNAVAQAYQSHSVPAPAKPPAQKSAPAEDTVHLSPTAKAASGDADHDGDSK